VAKKKRKKKKIKCSNGKDKIHHEAVCQQEEMKKWWRESADHGTVCFRFTKGHGTVPFLGQILSQTASPWLQCVRHGSKVQSQAERLAIRATVSLHKWHCENQLVKAKEEEDASA